MLTAKHGDCTACGECTDESVGLYVEIGKTGYCTECEKGMSPLEFEIARFTRLCTEIETQIESINSDLRRNLESIKKDLSIE